MNKYKLIFTPSFLKNEKRFLKRHPDIRDKYKMVLLLLQNNPYHPSLRLHKIIETDKDDVYSVSITLKYRIIIILIVRNKKIVFVRVWNTRRSL